MNEPLPPHRSASLPASPRPATRFPWRPFVFSVGGVLLAGFIFFSWVGKQNQNPPIPVPVRPSIPAKNGFDALKVAADKAARKDDVGDAIRRTPHRKWMLEEKRAVLQANRPMLMEARAALVLPYLDVDNHPSFRTPFPHYPKLRQLARTFVLAGQVARAEGNPQAAADYYLDAVTLGRKIPHQTPLLGRLVGSACEAIGRYPLWSMIDTMDAATATHSLARLNALQSLELPLAVTLQQEKFFLQRSLQEVFDSPQASKEFFDDGTNNKVFNATTMKAYITVKSRAVIQKEVGDYMDRLIAQSQKPYAVSAQPLPLPHDLIAKIVALPMNVRVKHVGGTTADALLRTMLALRIYRLRHGDYPTELSALVTQGILPALPDDPFAISGSFHYRRLTKGKYLLYSIGPDGKDDNGSPLTGKNTEGETTHYITDSSTGDLIQGKYFY